MKNPIRYLMFADTVLGEYQNTVRATNDEDAVNLMIEYLKSLGLNDESIYTVAGVWEHNPLFYMATKLEHVIS